MQSMQGGSIPDDNLDNREFLLEYDLEMRQGRIMLAFPAQNAPDSDKRRGIEMQIVEFSEFSRRRLAQGQAIPADAGHALPVTDRWAQLHTEATARESAEVVEFGMDADFWTDLQFRIAYPTHRLRRH